MSTDLRRRRSVGFKEEGNSHDAESKSSDSHLREEAIFENEDHKKTGGKGEGREGREGGGGEKGKGKGKGKEDEGGGGKKIFVKEEEIDEDEEEKEIRKAEQRRLIIDKYSSLAGVASALKTQGLESSNLLVGVDFTASNEENGEQTFEGRSLHDVTGEATNPYQRVIEILGKTLESFDADNLIPAFGFGDSVTTNESVFPFFPDRPCKTFREVLSRYLEIVPTLELSGPTNFGPLIREAINIVKKEKSFHILVIIADGQVVNDADTSHAIVEASNHPLSIIMVGVGDGPWSMMEFFDDSLPKRKFDNFRFVNFNDIIDDQSLKNKETAFAMSALMEVPTQFEAVKTLGYLKK